MKKVIVPAFQPILCLETQTISHYEALARVRDDSSTDSHTRLIRMGEDVGFIDLIDMAMLEQVLELLVESPRLTIAANFSVSTIERAANEVLPLIYGHLDLAGRLIVEITETVAIRDMKRLERFISAVRHAGCKVALDDYGSGFFNEGHIRHLKPEFVKLDGSLVACLAETGRCGQLEVARDVVAEYGGEIIAEIVDSEAKLRAVVASGIHYAQGYLIGYPTQIISGGIEVAEVAWDKAAEYFCGKPFEIAAPAV